MGRLFPLKFQLVPTSGLLIALLIAFTFCPNLWAAQMALVTADRAVIYADEQMSAPLGFVRKGKKIKVGDIARNRAQVYPILVSGKIAYIRVVDVSTEKESVDSTLLVAERFQKGTEEEQKTNYSVSLFNYASQITLDEENTELKSKDAVNWYGVSIRGGVQFAPRWDLDMLINFMTAKADEEVFRALEFGVGASLHMLQTNRFRLKLFGQGLLIPFATYAVGDDFRVNGFGFGLGGGVNATLKLGQNFGLETYGGIYYTKLSGFSVPEPYQDIAPSFLGTRLGAGINYQF